MANPTLTGFLDGGTVTFDENVVNAGPVIIDSFVSDFSNDADNFDGGTLTLEGGKPEDIWSINHEGNTEGDIAFDGTTVSWSGNVIGTAVGGDGTDLVITFNATATAAAIEHLIETLTYQTLSDNPATTRTARLLIKDAEGDTLSQYFDLEVTPGNDPVEITSGGGGDTANVSAKEGSVAATTVKAKDPDPGASILFSILDGGDATLFEIDPFTGGLTFKDAPDFDNPTDTDADNVHEVTVRATSGADTDDQTILVKVLELIEGTKKDDDIEGGDDDEVIKSGKGNDKVDGGKGNDQIDGGSGKDLLKGGSGDDDIRGGGGDDDIRGGSGKDKLKGGDKNDKIKGGKDKDKLFGEKGDDKLEGGDGDDLVEGGKGNDEADGGDGDDQIDGGDGKDQLKGGGGDDDIKGGDGDDDIKGGNGKDKLKGGDKDDKIKGGKDRDKLFGDKGRDKLEGGDGKDELKGGSGKDTLKGGDGGDILSGGKGKDALIGGKGKDSFVFEETGDENKKTIKDFEVQKDKISLDSKAFKALREKDLSDVFHQGSKAQKKDDHLLYEKKSGVLRYDKDGKGGKDAVEIATLQNKAALTEDDFLIV